MSVLNILGAIAPSLLQVIDQAVEDKDEAARIKAELSIQLIQANSSINQAASNIIIAEAQGEGWLQRNWRPMLMVWFAVLIGAYWFGFTPIGMPEQAIEDLFQLVQIGVGGYVIGRSGEKIAGIVAPNLGNR